MTPYAFFFKHAGYSYDPARETALQGRRRCARVTAAAERKAREAGCAFAWEVDPYATSADWSDESPAWAQWTCVMYSAEGEVLASLGAVDFGRDGEPWGDPYRRVVEAELAAEVQARAERKAE